MNKFAYFFGFLLFMAMPITMVHAVHVNGYYRSNGTYVQSYERTAPDGIPYNNYSYPGNYNPNTGNITGGSQAAYLNNYYGTSATSYSAPTTPTCPLNSYYNGSSCTCSSGYVVGTDYLGSQSCISGYSKCTSSLGAGAQYNSASNTCSCGYGYVQSAGKCVSTITYCTNLIGLMSQYNTLTSQCECMSGYEYNGSSCVYKTTTPTYYPAATCPSNSHESLTDSTRCQCNTGYQVNSVGTQCVYVAPAVTTYSAPSPQSPSKLTTQQINAIISLLWSFGADASVIANVQASLGR